MKKLAAALFTLVLMTTFTRAAILRGTIYDARLNALPKAIVEINSTPRQTMVTRNGEYAFNVTPGYYEITASLENTSTTTNALVTTEGDYRIDLVMIDIEIGELNPDEPNLPNTLNETLAEEKTQPTPTQNETIAILAIATLATATLAATTLFLTRFKKQAKIQAKKTARKKARREVEETVKEKSVVLTREQRELLEKIKELGGRLTQKELRKQVDYSEAKVSLDLDVLESQGLIKKIKKGRGNIIIAVE